MRRVRVWVRRHPRSLAGAVALGLGGFAATAFGVAPLAPDASALPARLVSAELVVPALAAQAEALADHRIALYRSETTRSGDTADTLLRRLGADDAAFAGFLRRDPEARRLIEGRPGKLVRAEVDTRGRVISLTARYPLAGDGIPTHFNRLVIERGPGGAWGSRLEVAPLQTALRVGSGIIRSNLFAAVDEADIPDPVATQMVEMFSGDVDFHRNLRAGDRFSVVYESLMADGEPVNWNQGSGRVAAAEFVNRGRAFSAVWYQGADGRGAYFGLDGQSRRRAFLASPLAFSRLTSGFAMRLHPILNTWRQHKGVDYGAPTGTPVRSVGDGRVEFSGWQNGYGNVVEVAHAGGRSTLYAHLSRIDVRKGQSIHQGDTIGAVGATGWATGPHLHFEFKINGTQVDPTTLAQAAEAATISESERPAFDRATAILRSKLEVARTLGPAAVTAAAPTAPRAAGG